MHRRHNNSYAVLLSKGWILKDLEKCSLAAFISCKAMVKLLIFLKVQFPYLADGSSVN